MGSAKDPIHARLFAGVMFCPGFDIGGLLGELERSFGPVRGSYGPVPFSWSDYYAREMGTDLQKLYLTYEHPIPREMLPKIKNLTNGIETQYSRDGHRTVNIDPGYIARDKLVLASTKDFYHRIYLGDGIYGEVTLHFRKGRLRHFSWTYPDFREKPIQDFITMQRAALVYEIRNGEVQAGP